MSYLLMIIGLLFCVFGAIALVLTGLFSPIIYVPLFLIGITLLAIGKKTKG